MGIAAFGVVAWIEVRHAAVEAAQTRLEVVTRRIADLLGNSVAQQKTQLATLARDRNVQRVVAGGEGPDLDSAVNRIRRADSASAAILAIQVWDSTGAVRFSSSPVSQRLDDAARRELLALIGPGDTAAIGPFRVDGDTVRYATFGPIRTGQPVSAWAVVWRSLASGNDSRNLTDLIGTHARFALGNTTGDVWTDLSNPVTAPMSRPDGAANDTTFLGTTAAGERVLGSRHAVEGSPWVVAIEFPYTEVVAPIMGLAQRLAVFGTVLLLLGGLIAFRIARSMARPIAELADAAEGLRAGDYSRRAPNGRSDELGELAHAFNSMATSIADARVKLEAHAQQS